MEEFKFPDVAEGIHEGKLIDWKVKEGDTVKNDQILCEMETDKSVLEITSPHAGKIAKLHFKPGDTVKVGQSLVTFGEGPVSDSKEEQDQDELIKKGQLKPIKEETKTSKEESQPKEKLNQPKQDVSTTFKILPRERKLAKDLGVDLSAVKGTGPNGRITKEDIEAASKGVAPKTPLAKEVTPTKVEFNHAASTSKTKAAPSIRKLARKLGIPIEQINNRVTKEDLMSGGPMVKVKESNASKSVKIEGIREKIANRMTESWKNVPHASVTIEIPVDQLVKARESVKDKMKKQGVKLTYLAYLIKAVSKSFEKYPIFNSRIKGNEIIMNKQVNVGFAVDTDYGLMVPNIKDANKKSVVDIAKEIMSLAQSARNKRLKPEEITGGSTTLTNVGSFGAVSGTAIINYPEVSIFMVNKIIERVELNNNKPEAHKYLPLGLTFDHRIVDGADAGRVLNFIAEWLANPEEVN